MCSPRPHRLHRSAIRSLPRSLPSAEGYGASYLSLKPWEADYKATLAGIESPMRAGKDTPEDDRLDVLVTLVQAYETVHHPIEAPGPMSAIEFRVEQLGLTRADLERLIGSSGRVSEVLNRRRRLTLRMIRRLSAALDIPADVLIQECPTDRSAA